MSLITAILSIVKGPDIGTLTNGESLLARLRIERESITAELTASVATRRELLLRDARGDQIAMVDKVIEGHHLALERLELKEDALVAQECAAAGS